MKVVGIIETELVYARNPGSASVSAVVPPDVFEKLEADRDHFGHKATWWYDVDPHSGEQRPAFTPIQGGRLRFIEGRGIKHGDRFSATFEVKEVKRQGVVRREMWLVDARPLGAPKSTAGPLPLG